MHHFFAMIQGEMLEGVVCCAPCARRLLSEAKNVSWWEVFDEMGNMVDSADKMTEDAEALECRNKNGFRNENLGLS